MFIIFAGVWTALWMMPFVFAVVQGELPYWYFYLVWLAPVGLAYGMGRCVGWIIRGFRKEKE